MNFHYDDSFNHIMSGKAANHCLLKNTHVLHAENEACASRFLSLHSYTEKKKCRFFLFQKLRKLKEDEMNIKPVIFTEEEEEKQGTPDPGLFVPIRARAMPVPFPGDGEEGKRLPTSDCEQGIGFADEDDTADKYEGSLHGEADALEHPERGTDPPALAELPGPFWTKDKPGHGPGSASKGPAPQRLPPTRERARS